MTYGSQLEPRCPHCGRPVNSLHNIYSQPGLQQPNVMQPSIGLLEYQLRAWQDHEQRQMDSLRAVKVQLTDADRELLHGLADRVEALEKKAAE